MKPSTKKTLATVGFLLATSLYAIAFMYHEVWPNAALGTLVAGLFATAGLFSIYSYVFGTHKGHGVYVIGLLFYFLAGAVFLVRSLGFLSGAFYAIIIALVLAPFWLLTKDSHRKIYAEKRRGIRRNYFVNENVEKKRPDTHILVDRD